MVKNNRQATASAKGYILQGYFGIYFFFKNKNYINLDYMKIEGKKEDIEITYYDNSKDFIQVKTHENPTKNLKFDTEKFKKAITTLYEAFDNILDIKINRLILANNMFNQGITRLNTKISNGDEENFIYNINNDFTPIEIEDFSKKIKKEIKNNLFLARVDETFLLENSNKILPELKLVINSLELHDIQENIQDSLKILFNENNCNKNLSISKKDVAWCFIKHQINYKKIYNLFNKDFEDELDNTGNFEIDILIDNYEMKNMIKNFSSNYQIYSFYERKITEYSIKGEKIITSNRKKIMSEIANEMLKKEILPINTNCSDEEKRIIYCFFVYCLHFNKLIKNIYEEFNILEDKNEIDNIEN